MEIRSLGDAVPFTTRDGSRIRSLLDLTTAPVQNQSLAEATVAPGEATERHYHRESEEIYLVVAGRGEMEVDGEVAAVGPNDAILIPPGSWHRIRAGAGDPLRILCCCAPPYRHQDTYFS